MVTHEPDIACYAKKRIYMRDGKIIREEKGREGCEDRAR
jgi:ABC-type lipoprotein export system ATPase subunit